MLQDIRNSSQSMAAKIVVGLIIVTFALFGVESIVGSLGGEPEVAVVNGKEITESKFERILEGRRRQIIAQMGENADPELIDEGLLRSSVLEGLIEEEVFTQDALGKGLFVSDQAVDAYIRNIEQFKIDGAFSNERLQMLLRNAGMTLDDYRTSLKSQFVLSQPRTGILSSAFVLDDENKELIALDSQERSFGHATVSQSDYLDAISVGDDDVAKYYEENKASYKKAENVDVTYVEVKRDVLASSVEVDDDALMAMYEQEQQEFASEEQREGAHILIKIDDSRSEEEALAKINTIAERVSGGESFEEIAKNESEDEGSAGDGGNLGLTGKGVFVSDFEDALYALSEGEVSAPVKTEFGYHLIKLLKIEKNALPSFDEMRASLAVRYQEQESGALYAELTERLADLSYSSPDLAEPAEELELTVSELAGVSAETSDAIFSNIKVQRVLFSDELVKDENNSELIEIEPGHAIVFRVNAYHEESVLPMDVVKEQVRQELAAQKAQEYAKSVGQAFILRIESGEEPKTVAEDMGLNWVSYTDVRRDNVQPSRDVVNKVFAIKLSEDMKDNIQGFDDVNGNYAIVYLTDVKDAEVSNSDSPSSMAIQMMISESLGGADYQRYQEAAINSAEIERI